MDDDGARRGESPAEGEKSRRTSVSAGLSE